RAGRLVRGRRGGDPPSSLRLSVHQPITSQEVTRVRTADTLNSLSPRLSPRIAESTPEGSPSEPPAEPEDALLVKFRIALPWLSAMDRHVIEAVILNAAEQARAAAGDRKKKF